MYPPDGLLTLEEAKHDVELNPHIIAPDPFASDDCLNVFPPAHLFLLTKTKELNKMNTSEDEPSSGLNGRLRPRKSNVPSPQTYKVTRKTEGKLQDKPKRLSTPSKTPPIKHDDLANKSDFSPTPQFLCAYCDRKFASKQTVSKHARRMHISSPKLDSFITCLFCNTSEANTTQIIRHMVEHHSDQYFVCLCCHTRFPSTSELAEHKLTACEKQKPSYRSKLRQKRSPGNKKIKKAPNNYEKDDFPREGKVYQDSIGFNGVVISCELKPSQVHDGADIEDNITTNLILPPSKSLGNNSAIEKNAVIVLDDIQWNKRIPPNFSFHNSDADQILSRLGVVHRSPRTGESNRKDWLRVLDDSTQKFEKCFDTSFYSKVASNVQENLSKFLDGSFNFNPDPDNTIKTRKSKNSVVINTAEGFPILLASEQYSRNVFDGYMPRAIAPKHKWKWDNLESDKNVMNPDQLKRDSHANNCIITLVSRLDIWTQLSMRRKFEEKFSSVPIEKKTEKRNIIGKQLKEILESREIPTTSSQVVKHTNKPMVTSGHEFDFPSSLGLTPSVPSYDLQPAVLSGEWVRPRCYVCCACGAQTRDSRALSSHISLQHPNAQVQHYEIVGERLLNSDILKHLYVPPSQMCNRTRPLRGFRDCTKCSKSITLEDLHQHMLDCAGDTPTVRRRQCRYRPFGVRKRRPRLPDNTIRKKMRNDIRTRQKRQKSHIRPRPKIRTEVGDAETIRKMIADLPAKRHRVMVNPTNQNCRPRRKLNQLRNKLIMKKRPSEDSTNRKKGVTRHASSQASKQGEFSGNIDKSKNLSCKEDDEDNKPLKPTLKRVINKRTRRKESVQRKPVLSKAKRKATPAKTKGIEHLINTVDGASPTEVEKLSIDDSPKKIDVKGGAYNTREHASRGGSNNHDMQRPSCSRRNGNPDNGNLPTQNVPLKHSIARLTANSETHDKSVQFHHSFLVQQECNNTNQHVPSGQHTLFENEAAVTRLDKPPLNSPKGSADSNALQKSKLNKPRKGLNDCIAMLKNKLVDPVPYSASSQVSVQCGTDEPIELEPLIPLQRGAEFVDTKNSSDIVETTQNSSQNCPAELNYENMVPTQELASISPHGEPDQDIKSQKKHDIGSLDQESLLKQKRGRTKHKSTRVSNSRSELIPQKLKETQPDNDINPEKCTVTTSTIQKLSKTDSHCDSNPLPINRDDVNKHRLSDVHNKSNSVKIKPTESPESSITLEKPLDKTTPLTDSVNEQNSSVMNISIHINKQKLTETCNVNNETSQKQTEIRVEPLNKKTTEDNFPDRSHCDVQADIPPAHASTHVESIVMTPLDLSGKMQNINKFNDAWKEESPYNSDDYYETLDLSNKCLDERLRKETADISEGVVDLSVKSSQSECQPSTLDLCVKSKKISNVTDLSMKALEVDVPTDLSMKGKDMDSSIDSSEKKDVQEWSGLKDKISQIECPRLPSETEVGNDSPTDLSGKTMNVQPLSHINEIDFRGTTNPTENLSDKLNYVNVPKELQMKSTRQLGPYKDQLHKKSQEKNVKTVQPRSNDKISTQIQKPVYDPTLKIPQYKIRAAVSTAAATISGSSDTVSRFSSMLPVPLQESSTNTNSNNIAAQERIFEPSKIPFNATICTTVGTVPVYTLPSRQITSTVSKYESTTPVYTLANACISVTKIEPASSATLTNTLLSIPMTTIANTTSVYTLAGTTIGAPINYAVLPNTGSQNLFVPNNCFTSASRQVPVDTDFEVENQAKQVDKENGQETKSIGVIDQEAETARKIAMLPKELVDILGNMPVDHRNQLLNVLPQYVSTSSGTSISETETVKTITNTTALVLQRSPPQLTRSKQINITDNMVTTSEPQIECPSNIIATSTIVHQVSKACQPSIQLTGKFDSDNKHSMPPSSPSPINFQLDAEDNKTSPLRTSQSSNEESITADEAKLSKELLASCATKRLVKKNEDRIIDLTVDESVSLNMDVVKGTDDLSRSINLPTQEITNFAPIGKNNKQKGNNDQTASLRAVRIKAPSQRHKENKLLKNTTLEEACKTKNSKPDDNEVNKLSESNKYLAIQQAEISSTQHSNKNVMVELKCTNEMPSTAPNAEGLTVQTRRLSTLIDEMVIEKDNNNLNIDTPIINKTGLVTSSISASQISHKESSDTQINEKILPDDQSNTFDSTIQAISLSGNELEKLPIKNNSVEKTIGITLSNVPEQNVALKKSFELDNTDLPITLTKNLRDSKIIYEEDSDDDVSLAIIVKQKQQKIVSQHEQDFCDQIQQDAKISLINKKKKRVKKLKNKISKENTLPERKITTKINSSVKKIVNSVELIEKSRVVEKIMVTTDVKIDDHSKINAMKNSDMDTAEKVKLLKSQNSEEYNINQENDKNLTALEIRSSHIKEIETDTTTEQTSVALEVSDALLCSDTIEVTKQKKKLSVNIESVKDSSPIVDMTDDNKYTEQIKSKVKSTKKQKREGKKSSEVVNKEIKHASQHEFFGKKSNMSEKSYTENDFKDKNFTGSNDVISTRLDKTNESVQTVLDDDSEENIYAGSEYKKYKTCTRTMKSSDTEYLNSSVISDTSSLHNEENTSTPLRRSRRGKSLFVEGFSSRYENIIQSEIFPDNKTPLTKKQLIFSKLLLDEENHTNPDTLDTEDTTLEKSFPFSNADDLSFASTPHISDTIDSSELASEKCKPIKRKKSPQIKQKSKKKKSLDTTQFSEKTTLTGSSPNDVEPVEKEASVNVSFSASDSVTHDTEDTKKTEHLIGDKLNRNQDEEPIINDLDKTISPVANNKLKETVHESVNNTKLNSTEKRKKGKNSESCSKPKKSKLITNDEVKIFDKNEDIQIKTDEPPIKNNKQEICAEPRTTTCYNVPVAARRTRSKSVVVKSSVANPYDPYDIDLDDMIGNDEPMRKKGCPTKESKITYKLKASNLSKANDIDTGDNILANESVDNITTKNVCEKNKTESSILNVDTNKLTKTNTETNIEKSVNVVNSSTFEAKSIKMKLTTDCDNTSDDVLDGAMDIADNEDVSDSDDSSKSDVPLKKYVEEKEKKIAELSKNSEKVADIDTPKMLNKKPIKLSHEITGSVGCVPDETEEQLRSEQFMESFGFFSERKPRKSNLLATKKISETFHIIANESDDIYFGFKERSTKRQNESRKSTEGEGSTQCSSKKAVKRGRKKKVCVEPTQCYCSICKKEFRRPDNYLRHQMTLLHVSKLSEIEMKVKTVPVHEEPNYLIAYKQHIDRLKLLTDKLAKQKKNAKSKIVLPTMADILADVNRTVRQQQLLRRGLSRDEALFLDCCELLKESHKTDGLHVGTAALSSSVCTACPVCPARSTSSGLDLLEKLINEDKEDTKSDGDVDSITAKTILESEEVRNLENDLISGLKEAANTHNQQNNVNYHQTISELDTGPSEACTDNFSSPNAAESHYDHIEEFYDPSPPNVSKPKMYPETKDMMYPDVQEIDMFEDKFDKIKRKCRSQAAAAKQNQPVVESSSSHKGRKKSDKKKGKKSSKKNYQNTVLTKGALKGFDGIKVSIPTSEINMPAIVQPLEIIQKKKKKSSSKKKREKREYNNKYETENCIKDSPHTQKKVDVYEFMDNEDAELFEFRPSTLMERFKSITNKDIPSTSKLDSAADDAENSSESGSDGDDFVYMSDDYVRSDDETENSLLSCELGNLKVELKKCSSPQKRKDVVEKNAVMGKIFKNAVRTEKKSVKCKEPENPKANLDQLFDSLLEEEPSSSMLNNDSEYHTKDDFDDSCLNDVSASKNKPHSRKSNDSISPSKEITFFGTSEKLESASSFVSPKRYKSKSPKHRVASPNKHDSPPGKNYEDAYILDYGPSTSKKPDISLPKNYGSSKKYDDELAKDRKGLSSKKRDKNSLKKYDRPTSDYGENSPSRNTDLLSDPKDSSIKEMINLNKFGQCNDDNTEIDQELILNDAGVARQRARRKCTVGKQNVLAETWSSESEPDGALPRSNSTESIVSGIGRKKKGRKKDGQPSGGRRGKHIAFKKQEIESRVTSCNRNASRSGGDVEGSRDGESVDKDVSDITEVCPPPAPVAQGGQMPASVAGPPGTKGRSRSVAYYWSSEGDDEQEHLQQHGWIVGDSHKKLVTMLAHAKGRKRNNDEKRHLVE